MVIKIKNVRCTDRAASNVGDVQLVRRASGLAAVRHGITRPRVGSSRTHRVKRPASRVVRQRRRQSRAAQRNNYYCITVFFFSLYFLFLTMGASIKHDNGIIVLCTHVRRHNILRLARTRNACTVVDIIRVYTSQQQ